MTGPDEPPLRPAVFLDRDGTLIEDCHYLSDPASVRLFDGAAGAVRRLRSAGYAVVLVTNQSGIGRGYFTEEDYGAVHEELCRQLAGQGTVLDGAYHCPDAPPPPAAEDRGASPPAALSEKGPGRETCRKPSPVLYRRAERELGLDLRRSWYVGDKVSDVQAAGVLGGKGVLVLTGYGQAEAPGRPPGCFVVDDVAGAAALICGSEPADPDR